MPLLLALALSLQADAAALQDAVGRLAADFLEDREAARKELEAAGAAAEKVLVEALEHSDHRVRRVSLELLAALRAKSALPAARRLYKTDDDEAAVDAAFRLLRALGADAEEALIEVLDSPNVEHVKGAIQALTEAKSEACVDRMAKLDETHPDPAVKEAAFRHLQGIGAPAEKYLLEALKSPDGARAGAALAGLRGSSSPAVIEAVGKAFFGRPETDVINLAFDHLKELEAKGVPALRSALQSPQEHARARSIEGLRGSAAAEAELGPVAERFRTDPSESVRTQAAEFLRSLGPKAEPELAASLGAENAGVRILAIRGLSELKSEAAFERVSGLFREDKDANVRREAFRYLCRIGLRAEKDLLFAMDDADRGVRLEAVQALGDAKSEAAIPRLLDVLGGLEADLKNGAMNALVRIGPPAIEAAEAALAAGRLKKAAADQIRALAAQEEVERRLDVLVTEDGGSGHFDGQFRELAALGKERVVPQLLRIVKDPGHEFRFGARRAAKVPSYPAIVRELAVMALGELGDPSALPALREAFKETESTGGNLRDELLVAMHRLGDPKPMSEFLEATRKKAEADLKEGRREEAVGSLFSLGIVLNRSGRRGDAEAAYLQLSALLEEKPAGPGEPDLLPNTWYNLACLASLKGDVAAGLERLRKAVKAGYRDRDWMKLDRDLDALRADPGYRALLADEALFKNPPR